MKGEFSFDITTLVTIINWAIEATPLRVMSAKQREIEIANGTYKVPQPKNLL
jgi:hypothetical protein